MQGHVSQLSHEPIIKLVLQSGIIHTEAHRDQHTTEDRKYNIEIGGF